MAHESSTMMRVVLEKDLHHVTYREVFAVHTKTTTQTLTLSWIGFKTLIILRKPKNKYNLDLIFKLSE